MNRRPGWFQDHWDPTVLREWDGEKWTGKTVTVADVERGDHRAQLTMAPPRDADHEPGWATGDGEGDLDARVADLKSRAPVRGPRRLPWVGDLDALPPLEDEQRWSRAAIAAVVIGIAGVALAVPFWIFAWTLTPTALVLGGTTFRRIPNHRELKGTSLSVIAIVLGLVGTGLVGWTGYHAIRDGAEAQADDAGEAAARARVLTELVEAGSAQNTLFLARNTFTDDLDLLADHGWTPSDDLVVEILATRTSYCMQTRHRDTSSWWHVTSRDDQPAAGPCPT